MLYSKCWNLICEELRRPHAENAPIENLDGHSFVLRFISNDTRRVLDKLYNTLSALKPKAKHLTRSVLCYLSDWERDGHGQLPFRPVVAAIPVVEGVRPEPEPDFDV